ncbi:hypothetical protein RLOC_00010998, partial [Lonchura striata]
MASVFQNVKATVAWRKHRLLNDLNENESPVPDKFKRRTSLSSLNTIHMSLRKRVPLKRVELNFDKTPTREKNTEVLPKPSRLSGDLSSRVDQQKLCDQFYQKKNCYTSNTLLHKKREFDWELELVSSGICQLKRISQAFDDAIVKEESPVVLLQATSNIKLLLSNGTKLTVCTSIPETASSYQKTSKEMPSSTWYLERDG